MPRIKLEFPETVHFSTNLLVRITDINYGGHLGNDSLLGIVHEARLQFLKKYGWTELDICGSGLIMTDALILFRGESFHGDSLQIDISVDTITKTGFELFYRVSRPADLREIARVKTGLLFFDYQKRKVSPTPLRFKKLWPKPELD